MEFSPNQGYTAHERGGDRTRQRKCFMPHHFRSNQPSPNHDFVDTRCSL
jgi:hypothetical protein